MLQERVEAERLASQAEGDNPVLRRIADRGRGAVSARARGDGGRPAPGKRLNIYLRPPRGLRTFAMDATEGNELWHKRKRTNLLMFSSQRASNGFTASSAIASMG